MALVATTRRKSGWDEPRPPSWGQFAAWTIVGPVGIAGILAAFTPLILITGPLTAVLILAITYRVGFNESALGAVSGLAVYPFAVALLSGLPTLPWLAGGVALVTLGVGPYLAITRRAR